MQLVNPESRLKYIDLIRGLGIFYMIFGHVGFGWVIDKYIHAFHMPIFFIISGYFFNKDKYNKSLIKFVKVKARSLLVPYIFFGLFHYIVWLIFIGYQENKNIKLFLKNLFWRNTNDEMPIAGALWFLTCLFILEITYYLLNKISRSEKWLALLLTCFSIITYSICEIFDYRLPYAADVAFVSLPFFYIGNLLKLYSNTFFVEKITNINHKALFFLFLASTILVFLNGYVNLRTAEYSFLFMFYINAVVCYIFYLNLAKKIVLTSNHLLKKASNCIEYLGRNSLVFLLLNQLIIYLLTRISINFKDETIVTVVLTKIIILGLSIIILIVFNELLNRKLKYIIGK